MSRGSQFEELDLPPEAGKALIRSFQRASFSNAPRGRPGSPSAEAESVEFEKIPIFPQAICVEAGRWLPKRGAARAPVRMILLVCSFLAGCAPSLTYRYRLTVEVDTPQGVRIGSSVIENTWTDYREAKWGIIESRLLTTAVRGDAPVVDLGGGRLLVALLAQGALANGDPDFKELMPASFGISWWKIPLHLHREAVERARLQPGRRIVPDQVLPTLITFRDPSEPQTVQAVAPSGLEAVFGSGYRLRAVTVEVTNEQVTRNVTRWLPWAATIQHPAGCNQNTQLCLDALHFRRG